MPWETTPSVVSGSPSNKRNVGILEVKMKHRLERDISAVAIGSAAHHHSSSTSKQQQQLKKKPRKAHRLPHLLAPLDGGGAGARPQSFETDRQQIMDKMALPSPTRSLIQKHIDHVKHDQQQQQAQLPPVAGAFKKKKNKKLSGAGMGAGAGAACSHFPQAYQRGELPIMIDSQAGGQTLKFTKDLKTLDYSKLLPLFLDGMQETAFPYSFMAREGAIQLVQFGHQYPERLLDCLPRVVLAVRSIMDLRSAQPLRDALLVLQSLAKIPGVGMALVPYYRTLLPVLNVFKTMRRNLGDSMDFQQKRHKDVSEMVVETLELLEIHGGPDAFVNIKYMVPTYEGTHPQG